MKIFLSIAGALALLFGFALLFFPQAFYAPTGMTLTPLLATLAEAHGATLTGLGTINILARTLDPRSAMPVLAGNLVVQVLSLGVVLHTMRLGAGLNVLPGVIIHVVLGGLFAWFYLRSRRSA